MRGGQSRRRCLRRAVSVACAVHSNYWDGAVELPALDMSHEGLWLDSPLALDRGEELIVSFRPPGARDSELWATAEVARVALHRRARDVLPSGMGLRFTYLHPRDRDRLQRSLTGRPPPLPKRDLPHRSVRAEPPPLPSARLAASLPFDAEVPAVLDVDIAGELQFVRLSDLLTSPARRFVRAMLVPQEARLAQLSDCGLR